MQVVIENNGRFETENSRKYMTQLVKHFGHKVPAQIDGDQGRVTFAMGTAEMQATDDALTAHLTAADDKAIEVMQAIIDDHLKRFAFREEFTGMDWQQG